MSIEERQEPRSPFWPVLLACLLVWAAGFWIADKALKRMHVKHIDIH